MAEGRQPKAVAGQPKPQLNGVQGRWIRVTSATEPAAEQPLEREVSDPLEAAAVRAGWLLVDAHERLSNQGATRVFGHENNAWHEYAATTVRKLQLPPGALATHVHESRNNTLRYRRTMDFARAGDRVFDVGFGQGYLAAQLLLERGVASYRGIDIIDTMMTTARNLFQANGLADADIKLATGDLHDLTRGQLDEYGATLVVCCEVLEHVESAERALGILADALPEDADLIFSVPLHGRLENVWGHVSVFDVARLKGMLDRAGLYAHHVEPLANAWTIVVASRDPAASERVRAASRRPPVRVSSPLVRHRDFVNVKLSEFTGIGDSSVTMDTSDDRNVLLRTAGDRGGVEFPVDGLEALRLDCRFVDVGTLETITVQAKVAGKKAGEWVWEVPVSERVPGLRSFSLRPGQWSPSFVGGVHRGLHEADRVTIIAHTTGGAAEIEVRAAYLP